MIAKAKPWIICFCLGVIGAYGSVLFTSKFNNVGAITALTIAAIVVFILNKSDTGFKKMTFEIVCAIMAGVAFHYINFLGE
ncbi:MAG: hypothetical protein ACTTJF_04785 [Campylobacter sp.]|jgi:hypothetical protein|uniref:hypothetical protein n=1 Tax=Campylobacter sp. TaxID=205 RepID=UPI003FA0E37E